MPAHGKVSAYFSFVDIRSSVRTAKLALTDGSLKVYLSEAVTKGLIHDAGRGWYSRLAKPLALDPRPVRKLVRAVEKAFPLLDFCAWSTVQLNPWMHHLLAQPVHFLHAQIDALESVGDHLRDKGWEVAVNPPSSIAAKDVQPGEKMVVLRPALGRQPPPQGRQAAIEQVLVDLIVECDPLALMERSEAEAVVAAIMERHLVQIAPLKRYAESRKHLIPALAVINQRHSTGSSDNR